MAAVSSSSVDGPRSRLPPARDVDVPEIPTDDGVMGWPFTTVWDPVE